VETWGELRLVNRYGNALIGGRHCGDFAVVERCQRDYFGVIGSDLLQAAKPIPRIHNKIRRVPTFLNIVFLTCFLVKVVVIVFLAF